MEFEPDDQWDLAHFLRELEYKEKKLCFSSDYVTGRLMKTDITFESGGRVTLSTRNRGKSAERRLLDLLGRRHIQAV
jgi:hypothetical protein